MADDSGDLRAFLVGFVIGGLIGAGVALFLAPQSGEETRAMIADKSIELRDRAMETAGEIQANVGEYASQTAQSIEGNPPTEPPPPSESRTQSEVDNDA